MPTGVSRSPMVLEAAHSTPEKVVHFKNCTTTDAWISEQIPGRQKL